MDEGLYRQPPNTMTQIKEIWAFLAVDPEDGNEGMAVYHTRFGPVPMIAADEKRLADLRPMAHDFAKEYGVVLKLVKFTIREEIESFGVQ